MRGPTIAAAALCWVPLLVIVAIVVVTWPLLAGEISTQWSGDDVVTRAPGWTLLLLPVTGTLVCGIFATVVAADRASHDGTPHDHRRSLAVCGAVGVVLMAIVIVVVVANLRAV